MQNKTLLIVLIGLNLIVLIGELWPEAAPAFVRSVNVVFLVMSFLFFAAALTRARKNQ